ncbi:MAG: glycosyltransferase family 2 protein, partial [Chloroflexi bacterium]|nr:glycosyltransferase family 2 protein [Chloroflexota bacterium]
LADCLRSVYDTVGDLEYEIFVVDNASSDGSAAMVREQFPAVRLVENAENAGFARANNQAIAQASGEFLLLLNSDAVLLPGSVRALLKFAHSHPRAGVVVATLLNPDGTFQAGPNDFPTLASVVAEAFGVAAWLYRRPVYPSWSQHECSSPSECDWVGGACLLARSSGIAQVGLLDEDYFLNSEEVDWCYRWKEASWQVWHDPRAQVIHYGGASAGRQSAEAKLRLWRGKITFMRKHRGWAQAAVAVAACRLGALVKTGLHLARFTVSHQESERVSVLSNWALARGGGSR